MILPGAAAPALLLAAGSLVAWRWLGGGCTSRARRSLWSLALAPAIGFGAPALVVTVFALCSVRLPAPAMFATLLGVVFSALCWIAPRFARVRDEPAKAEPARETRVVRAIALATLAIVLLTALPTLSVALEAWPIGTWDAVAMWSSRARLLHLDAAVAASHLAASDPESYPHNPLLVPAAVASSWTLAGSVDAAVPKAVSVTWFAGCLLLVFLALSRAGHWAVACAATALTLATPVILKWAPSQCADLSVAYTLLLATLAAASALGSGSWPADRLPRGLAGAAIGLLLMTKVEGIVLGLVVAVSLLVADTVLNRRTLRGTLLALTPATPFLIVLLLQRLRLAPATQTVNFFVGPWLERLTDPSRWRTILAEIYYRVDLRDHGFGWYSFWPLVVLAFLASLMRSRDQVARTPMFLALAAAAALILAAFTLTSFDLRYYLEYALDRLLLQVAPLALVYSTAPLVFAADARGVQGSVLRGVARRLRAAFRPASSEPASLTTSSSQENSRSLATTPRVVLLVLLAAVALSQLGSLSEMTRWIRQTPAVCTGTAGVPGWVEEIATDEVAFLTSEPDPRRSEQFFCLQLELLPRVLTKAPLAAPDSPSGLGRERAVVLYAASPAEEERLRQRLNAEAHGLPLRVRAASGGWSWIEVAE